MADITFLVRMELMRVNSKLTVSQADSRIRDTAECFFDVTRDNEAHGANWEDFYNYSLLEGVALATIYRERELELFAFAANESLIRVTKPLAMVDVTEFLATVRRQFQLPEHGLRFAISEALPWMQSVLIHLRGDTHGG